MENYVVKGEHGDFFIPDISFDIETGIFEITGESYLEDTVEFYSPLIEWIKQFTEEYTKPITVNFKLSYYNTSSSRSLLDILNAIKEYERRGNDVEVNWYHKGSDPEVEEEVEDYMLDTELKINLVEYNR
ncbi:MAG: DUF1987 domain-containing protein [Bacteroidales bacterium]|nr:DUF1987 domain-containing protein [Bacteroidales bacterium]